MEQDRLKVEEEPDEWAARLPQGRAGAVFVRNAGTGFRMFAGNPATK